MTIVSQSSSTQKKVSNHLGLLVLTFPRILFPSASLLSPLLQKNRLIQLRLTRRLPHFYNLLTIPQLQTQTPLLLQLDYSSQFPTLETINLKLQKNFLHLVNFCRTLDPFFHVPTNTNFNLIVLFLDVNIVVNTMPITHGEQNDPASVNIYNTVSNQNSPHGK